MDYTPSQIIALWRQAAGLEPMRTDVAVTVTAGIDTDAALEARIRAWYVELLHTGHPRFLVAEDIGPRVALSRGTIDPTIASFDIPAGVMRVLSVRAAGWERPATVLPSTEAVRRSYLAANPYSAAGTSVPIAIDYGDYVVMQPVPADVGAVEIRAVVDPGPTIYRMQPAALTLMQHAAINAL